MAMFPSVLKEPLAVQLSARFVVGQNGREREFLGNSRGFAYRSPGRNSVPVALREN